ncbi:bifunctional adenosylcobinamide kinase/adenosylcobinamide-phosphate guanylyltransferase [Sphingomonas sp. PL-96]|uniref:bifunctional adenosylcobinamide kinase/adenosylcobinamide-phosphate guanylyltransferase n=1 Tax=Sphingomonas sp. PL-96 TaxID=2887201 RepID=UPI001E55B5CB|nr:bifunctional adenosylcobinamide kinase/adenosylcobinamide-phosphate guanylyltransferase [Sphingomonas sp. PL-96]MCC2975902.1 bifunctional adenosylcobinamide kinase/adenosylcobinamide-phosphate guanylyltransferase [Sphingomonas sp. PL-96]
MRITGPDRTMLVLGGARSGKSRYAQAVAEAAGGRLVFVATAQAFDDEMTDRIRRHQADRDTRWTTVEAPLDVAGAIAAADGEEAVLLVDCLTLWASNLLLGEEDADARLTALLEAIAGARGQVVLVANEVGLGIVPDNALARRFRDLAGTINQRVAAAVDRVHMTVAGIPIVVKG